MDTTVKPDLAALEHDLAAIELGTPRGRIVVARVPRRCAACGERVVVGALARHVRRATLVCAGCAEFAPDEVLEAAQ